MNESAAPTPATKLPWYIEHRMRALLIMLGSFLVFGAIVFTTVYVLTVNNLKSTVPYQMAVERVVNYHAVQSNLGRPVEPAWLAAGQVNDKTGYTEMTFRIAGPTGKGTVRAILERDPADDASEWELVFLDVATYSDFGVEMVEIINDKPPTGMQLPEPTPEAKKKYGVEDEPEESEQ
ncbi:MAG: cytochrome c oxidase assembly factor Coa1 family protein [Planctomycetota bacterium]